MPPTIRSHGGVRDRGTDRGATRGTGRAAQRAVTALHEIGHTVDEKRARQILRDLAAEGLLQHIDAERALYRLATDPEK
ncbi:hypothetical protein ACFYTG_50550 [Streptomyces mirabilis]|uniref:hypothetical protein n=1 Tax=Streptomyces mirabilis TaxID=68239 RepID=UPI0036908CB4